MRVRFEPQGVTVEGEAGQTLLNLAREARVDIESICGGRGTCGKCKVSVTGDLEPLTPVELARLDAEEVRAGYRLACQARIAGDVQVVVPEESRVSRVSILVDGISDSVKFAPWVRRLRVSVPEPSLDAQIADLDRLRFALSPLGLAGFRLSLEALRQLPAALRVAGGEATVVVTGDRLVNISPAVDSRRLLGMAFDIGTTTVVGYLLDLETGEQPAVASLLNPQTRYGDDVVSRIGYAGESAEALETLRSEIVGAMNAIMATCVAEVGAEPEDVYGITVAGNTTMIHLFLGVNPEAMARAPYVPAVTDGLALTARELGLQANPEALVWTLPSIAGWVGADTVAVILATRLYEHEEPALAVDIGTNGEIVIGSAERLVACSTAAGPAFEGAHLSCGMRAADGAIDAVRFDHQVTYHVIGDLPARGVCGSGLVDLVAEMLRTGVIDATGMIQDPEVVRSNSGGDLAGRILRLGRQRVFELVPAHEGAGGKPIMVTQRDVRELQLAKGAIRAGIEISMRQLGIGPEAIKRVYLAGAFGNYIRPASALAIGLMPMFPNARIVPVGNAAGSGARLALLSEAALKQALALPRRVEYIELSARADFQDRFAEAMIFPAVDRQHLASYTMPGLPRED